MTTLAGLAAALAVMLIAARAVLSGTSRHRRHRRRTGRRVADPAAALTAQLDHWARTVRAGESLGTAVLATDRDGAWLRRADAADLTLVAHTLDLCARVGGNQAAMLDGAASTLRARSAIRAEARAHSAQARLSVRVLTVLPLVVAAWTASSAGGRAALTSPIGLACLAAGAALDIVGWWWMRRLVRAVEAPRQARRHGGST